MSYSFGALDSPIDLGQDFDLERISPVGGTETDNWVGRSRHGDFIPATNQQRNKRTLYVATFRAIKPDGADPSVTLGGAEGYEGFIATRVSVRQVNTEDATVEVQLHEHDGNGSLHGPRAVAVTLPLSGYGVLAAPLGGGLSENLIGMEWVAEIGHIDRKNRLGDHLVGFSFGCRIDVMQEYVDDEGSFSPSANYFVDSDLPAEENTDARTRRIAGHSFLALS